MYYLVYLSHLLSAGSEMMSVNAIVPSMHAFIFSMNALNSAETLSIALSPWGGEGRRKQRGTVEQRLEEMDGGERENSVSILVHRIKGM